MLPQHSALRRQLSEYTERVSKSGTLTYSGSGRHDDLAAVCVTLGMVDFERRLAGSPTPRGARFLVFDPRTGLDQYGHDPGSRR